MNERAFFDAVVDHPKINNGRDHSIFAVAAVAEDIHVERMKNLEVNKLLATPEGRAQLKQMIEEAEKEQSLTLDEAIAAIVRLYGKGGVSWQDHKAAWDGIKAAAQREYGQKQQESATSPDPLKDINFRDMNGELSLCDNWHPADKRGKELYVSYIQRDSDVPMGIVLPRADVVKMHEYITRWLALSTLEEK